MKIMKNGIRLMDGNDIVFGQTDWSLYAWGCKFGCKHCHTKHCNGPIVEKDTRDIVNYIICNSFGSMPYTLCLMGGDVYFQQEELLSLLERMMYLQNFRIVIFSGAEPVTGRWHTETVFGREIMKKVDGLVLGRSVVDGHIVKHIMTAEKTERKLVKIV